MEYGLSRRAKIFIGEYSQRRELIIQLILRDFRLRFVGSAFGFLWAFLQPLALMSVLYVVFRFGLKNGTAPVGKGIPFISWFFSGMIAWNFVQEVLTNVCSVYSEYSFLVKKVNFRLGILPLVKIMSALLVHGVFIFLVVVINYGQLAVWSWYPVQLVYYCSAMIYLLLGISWIISSLHVFFRDISQLVAIFTQIGFWLTPIIWSVDILPRWAQVLIKLNPFYYLIEGYRKSLVYQEGCWEGEWWLPCYFWGISTVIFIGGALLYKKLKPYFADVL